MHLLLSHSWLVGVPSNEVRLLHVVRRMKKSASSTEKKRTDELNVHMKSSFCGIKVKQEDAIQRQWSFILASNERRERLKWT